jgi:hypothetical protein
MVIGARGLSSDASVHGRTEKNKKKEALTRCAGLGMCLAKKTTTTGPKSSERFPLLLQDLHNLHFWDHPPYLALLGSSIQQFAPCCCYVQAMAAAADDATTLD